MSEMLISPALNKPRRQVSIRRDGDDFVVAFLPEDFVIFRHHDVGALRTVCRGLRWEILRDTPEEDRLRNLVMEPFDSRRS
jgi:hypothetical protein